MSSGAEPRRASNVILIGKKPLMTYVTATLVQLASEPTVIVKARGKSIVRSVLVLTDSEKHISIDEKKRTF